VSKASKQAGRSASGRRSGVADAAGEKGVAIFGTGSIADTHARAVRSIPGLRLVGIWGRNAYTGRPLAAQHQCEYFNDAADLAGCSDVHFATVATASGAHLEAALHILRAGKPVLCEKPLEVTTERAGQILAEAERRGLRVGGFFPLRTGVAATAIRRAIREGRFGRLVFLSARIKWWREAAYYRESNWRGTWRFDGGGALMNQGIHAVDLLQWFGGAVHEVQATAANLVHEDIEVEDTLAATLRFANGALGSIQVSTACYPGLDLSVEVSGEGGTAVLVNDRIERWSFREPRDGDGEMLHADGGLRGGTSDPKAISIEGHRRQIEAFAFGGDDPDEQMPSGQDACSAVALVEAVYRAVRSKNTQTVAAPYPCP
jgi:UDP-N-acetyl-2-amino-2-deoxyglucuronate dehydrogenase